MKHSKKGFGSGFSYSQKSMFFPAKHPRLAKAISIKSPSAFKSSIGKVKHLKGYSAATKKRALVLARNRAGAQLGRSNLSGKEQREMRAIKNTAIPKM